MATYNAICCGYTDKSISNGFIQTMQFVENQHNLTLKALIHSYWIVWTKFGWNWMFFFNLMMLNCAKIGWNLQINFFEEVFLSCHLLIRHYIALKYGVAIHVQITLDPLCCRMLYAGFFKIQSAPLTKNLLLKCRNIFLKHTKNYTTKDYDLISIEDCYVVYSNTPTRGLVITELLLLKYMYSYA